MGGLQTALEKKIADSDSETKKQYEGLLGKLKELETQLSQLQTEVKAVQTDVKAEVGETKQAVASTKRLFN